MTLTSFSSEFLSRRGLHKPDGRPLYAYRCSDEEFDALLQALASDDGLLRRASSPSAAAGFCLFVSEWWRKNYDGGPWAWDPILDAAGLILLSWPGRHKAVETGLRYWRRELLQTGAQRGFLATLACEGGLPLKMLRHQGASLQRYFRAVLQAFHEYRRSGVSPTRLAEMESRYLQRSFRQDVVFTLAGDLCETIWELQSQIGSVDNPVAHLDQADPEWRDRFPLRIEDDTARALLNNLVLEASRLSRVKRVDFKVVRSLYIEAMNWQLEAELRIPPKLGVQQIQEVFGLTVLDLLGRFEIHSARDNGDRALQALVTQVGSGDERQYHIEVPPGIERTRKGLAAASGWSLLAASGARASGLAEPPGASVLSDLPWAFVDKEGLGERLEFLGEGSLRTRHETAYLAVPSTTVVEPLHESSAQEVGDCQEFNRRLYQIRGEIVCTDDEYGKCIFRTADRQETSAEFKLSGAKVYFRGSSSGVFLGAPTVREYRADAVPRKIPAKDIEWRSAQGGDWQPWSQDCLGDVVLRVVDAGGALRTQMRAAIAPSQFKLTLRPGNDRGGSVELSGILGGIVGLEPHEGIRGDVEHVHQGIDVRISARAEDVAPVDLGLRIRWGDDRQITLRIPFPALGVRFIGRDGRPLQNGETIACDRLAGVTVTATQAGGAGNFVVLGDLNAPGISPELSKVLWMSERLQPAGPGRWELDLRAVRSRVNALLNTKNDQYATVRLLIEPSLGSEHVQLKVSHFNLAFERAEETDEVRLDSEYGFSKEIDLNNFHVETVPLWDHTAERIPLAYCGTEDDPYVWKFGCEQRAPGPWLILGHEGAWCRVRPAIWNVEGEICQPGAAETAPSQISDIVRIKDHFERNEALDTLFEDLAEDPADQRWSDLSGYLKAFDDLPATTLDLMNSMVCHPMAVITALLNAGEADFERVMNFVEQTPFSWHFVPVASWTRAAVRLAMVLREQLKGMSGAEDIVWGAFQHLFEKAPAHEPFFQVIVEWLAFTVFQDRKPACPYLQAGLSDQGRMHVRKTIMEEYQLLLQTHAEGQWPEGREVTDRLDRLADLPADLGELLIPENQGTQFRLGVANAPILAAIVSICAMPVPPLLIQDIKSLRGFDENWFEKAYAMTLLIGIGQVFESDHEMLV